MVERIYEIKNDIIEHIMREATDLDRVNVKELGEFVDMIKDLAEAEKECWEASYYKEITESMHSAGEGEESARSGYGRSGMTRRSGYGTSGATSGGASRSGYHSADEVLEMLGEEYHSLSPDERRVMKNKVLSTLGIK